MVVCAGCRDLLAARTEWRCDLCGGAGFGSGPDPGRRCRLCPSPSAHYQGVFSLTGYGPMAARCIHQFKYGRRIKLGRLMSLLMCDRLDVALSRLRGRLDVCAPVPLHPLRRMWRGFNQSIVLGRPLAGVLGLPFEPRLLRRVRHTRRQALVPREQREGNIRGAFRLQRGHLIVNRGILLIDDVVTSGGTVNECARVLREAGAREVWVASFARAGMEKPETD